MQERVPSKPQYVEALKSIQKSNLRNYFIKIENMKDNKATMASINNYIFHLSSKFNLELNFVEPTKSMQSPLWIICQWISIKRPVFYQMNLKTIK